MKRKSLMCVVLSFVLMTISACSGATTTANVEDVAETLPEETVIEVEDTKEPENEVSEIADTTTAELFDMSTLKKEDYFEAGDVYLLNYDLVDLIPPVDVSINTMEENRGEYTLTDSLELYQMDGYYAGYSKENIPIHTIKNNDEWYYLAFAKSAYMVRAEDFLTSSRKEETKVQVAENNNDSGNESNSVEDIPVENVPVEENAVVADPEPDPVPATKYTEAEVIAKVEGALRGIGLITPAEFYDADMLAQYGPSGGLSWGMGDYPMDDSLDSVIDDLIAGAQFGGYKYYYIESLGSSNGYVTLKIYSGR